MNIEQLNERFTSGHSDVDSLDLSIADCRIRIRATARTVVDALRDYFRQYVEEPNGTPDFEIRAVERDVVDPELEWTDWPREAGKSGQKERYSDLEDGRVIHKVRTGMVFLLSPGTATAVGPCLENSNQVINLVNNQYITWVMNQHWQLCHAAGIGLEGKGLGMAGFSGAGKSTLALHLIEQGASFVSNDRLLVTRSGDGVTMRGVPKQPRVQRSDQPRRGRPEFLPGHERGSSRRPVTQGWGMEAVASRSASAAKRLHDDQALAAVAVDDRV